MTTVSELVVGRTFRRTTHALSFYPLQPALSHRLSKDR